jgi:hypothetical protein
MVGHRTAALQGPQQLVLATTFRYIYDTELTHAVCRKALHRIINHHHAGSGRDPMDVPVSVHNFDKLYGGQKSLAKHF